MAYVDKERDFPTDNWIVAIFFHISPSHAVHHVEQKHFQEGTRKVEDQFDDSESHEFWICKDLVVWVPQPDQVSDFIGHPQSEVEENGDKV